MMVRLMRSHDCRCGFNNEFEVARFDQREPNPEVDREELEVCPGAGCKQLVAVSRVYRIAADAKETHLLEHR